MASKSRRQRRKQALKDDRKRSIAPVTTASEPVMASQTTPATPPPPVSTTQAARPVPAPQPAAISYPHVAGELKRIGIIAAIMLAVLAILSRVIA